MGDFLSSDLRKMFVGLMNLYEMAYQEVKQDVECVILNGIKDENIIDHIFDNIMNIPTDKGYELFVDFCDYVSDFNNELAIYYAKAYDELYGEDDIDINKKM